MKKVISTISIIFIIFVILIISILSTVGYETNKFNNFIENKISENNKSVNLKLEKIKFKFDIKKFNLFLGTKTPSLKYKNQNISINSIKVYLDFISLITSKPKINKVNILSKEINLDQLKNVLKKTKPSTLNSYIINQVNDGEFIFNLELYFDEDLKINNYITKGEVRDMNTNITKDLIIKKINFNFFADKSDILVKNIKAQMNGVVVKEGNFQIQRNKEINLKSDFKTEIKLNKENSEKYLSFFKKNFFVEEEVNLTTSLDNILNITFDETFKIKNYTLNSKGNLKNLIVKLKKSIQNPFLKNKIENIHFKNTNFEILYDSNKKNNFFASGNYSLNNQNYQKFQFKNDFTSKINKIDLNLDLSEQLNIEFINYEKLQSDIAKINLNIITEKDFIHIKKFNLKENKNLFSIENLKLRKENLISLGQIKVKTYKKNDLKNDLTVEFGKKVKIYGTSFDAKNLGKYFNNKSNNKLLDKINKNIDIDIKNIDTPLSKKLKNFKLIGIIEKGKFVKISSKGDFGNDKYLDITMKNDEKSNKKYLEIYSDSPQPLLAEYPFFKGLMEGNLTFSSIIDVSQSSSKLLIEDFKVINAPGMVKLLSLADFGGLADLAEGEGLSFERLEIKMSKNDKLLTIKELFAVGPSISVLMDGYSEVGGLVSLRGTLVPAKNLNKFLSKIPVIGNIIIPKEVGEGLFGVSFKMKGNPGKIKTTINPIKTLTPRFITKALEKSKKSK